MTYTFKRRRWLQGCFSFFALGIIVYVVCFSWFVIPPELWPLKAFFIVLGLGFGVALPAIFIDTFSGGPILTISIEGIRYLSFSRETVPWSAIRNVTLTRAYSHQRGSSDYYRFKLGDAVSFTVDDPTRFPPPRAWFRINEATVPILPASVSASPQEIIDAVRACWTGVVREVDDAPSDATLH